MLNCHKNHRQPKFFQENRLIFKGPDRTSDKTNAHIPHKEANKNRKSKKERACADAIKAMDEMDFSSMVDFIEYVKALKKKGFLHLKNIDHVYEWTVEPIKGSEASQELCDRITQRKMEMLKAILDHEKANYKKLREPLKKEIDDALEARDKKTRPWRDEAERVALFDRAYDDLMAIDDLDEFKKKTNQLIRDGYVLFEDGEFKAIKGNIISQRLVNLIDEMLTDFDIGVEDLSLNTGPVVEYGSGVGVEEPFDLRPGAIRHSKKAAEAAREADEKRDLRDAYEVNEMQKVADAIAGHLGNPAFIQHIGIKTFQNKNVSKQVNDALYAVVKHPDKFAYTRNEDTHTTRVTPKDDKQGIDPDFLIVMNADYKITQVHDIPLANAKGDVPWWEYEKYFEQSLHYNQQFASEWRQNRFTGAEYMRAIQGLNSEERLIKTNKMVLGIYARVSPEVQEALELENGRFIGNFLRYNESMGLDIKYSPELTRLRYHFERQGKDYKSIIRQRKVDRRWEIVVAPDEHNKDVYLIITRSDPANAIRINKKLQILGRDGQPDPLYQKAVMSDYYRDNPDALTLEGVNTSLWQDSIRDRAEYTRLRRRDYIAAVTQEPALRAIAMAIADPGDHATISAENATALTTRIQNRLDANPDLTEDAFKVAAKSREVYLALDLIRPDLTRLRTVAKSVLSSTPANTRAIDAISNAPALTRFVQSTLGHGSPEYNRALAIFNADFDQLRIAAKAVSAPSAFATIDSTNSEVFLRQLISVGLNNDAANYDRTLTVFRLDLADLDTLKTIAKDVFPAGRQNEISGKKDKKRLADEIKEILRNDPTKYSEVLGELYS